MLVMQFRGTETGARDYLGQLTSHLVTSLTFPVDFLVSLQIYSTS